MADKINWDDPSTWQEATAVPTQGDAPSSYLPPEPQSSGIDWDNPSTWQQQAPPSTATPEADSGLSMGDIASDAGAAFGIGSGSLASGIGWLADKLGADDVGESLKLIGQGAIDYYQNKLSPEAKAEMDKEFVTTKEGGKWYNPLDWERPEDAAGIYAAFLMGMESIPATVTGMGVGGKVGQGLFKVAEKTGMLKALQTTAEVGARRAAVGAAATDDLVKAGKRAQRIIDTFGKTTGAIGYGLGEALPSAGMSGLQVEDAIQQMPHEELWKKSDHYREAFNSTEGLNMTMEERISEAKDIVSEIAGSEAGMQAGIATFLLGAPAGAFSASLFNKAISKPFATGKIAGTLKEAAGEGVQEFFQSGAEQFAQNLAVKKYGDETLELSKGVINQAVGGAVSGMGMGGAFGLAGTPTKGQQAASDASQEAQQKLKDDRYKLEEFGTRAHAALMETHGMDSASAMEVINPIIEKYAATQNIVEAVSDLRHLEKYGRVREKGVDDQATTFEGIPLTLEAERNGVSYFQIDSSVGADGGRMDAMMPSQPVGTGIYVIEQVKADGTFDEHKVVLGVASEEEAVATYQRYYRGFDDEQDRNVGSVTAMNDTEFQDWLKGTTEEHGTNLPTTQVMEEQEAERAALETAEGQPTEPVESEAAPAAETETPAAPEAEPVDEVIAKARDVWEKKGAGGTRQAENIEQALRQQGREDDAKRFMEEWDRLVNEEATKRQEASVPRETQAKEKAKKLKKAGPTQLAKEESERKAKTVPKAKAQEKIEQAEAAAPQIITDTNVGRAKKAAEKGKGVKNKPLMFSLSREEYQTEGMHTAPERDGYSAPAHDVTGGEGIYPDDIYGDERMAAQYYGHRGGNNPMDRKAIRAIQKLRGKPDAKITIYRAVPSDVGETDINPGDWVTLTREYAEQHAERFEDGGQILTKEVTADELFTDGNSIHEWGYQPKEVESRFSLSEKEQTRRQKASERMSRINRDRSEQKRSLLRTFLRFNWSRIVPESDAQTAGATTRDEVQDAIIEWITGGVQSRYFKRWFGESKVVDEGGVPLVLYHGTPYGELTQFNPSANRFISLTTNPEYAAAYSGIPELGNAGVSPTIYPVYVKAEKMFDFRNPKMRRSLTRYLNKNGVDFKPEALQSGNWGLLETEPVQNFLRQHGYDAFWMTSFGVLNVGVLDARNIKSAVGNVGTFQPTVSDMRYSLTSPKTGPVFYSQIEKWVQENMPPKMPVEQAIQAFSSEKALGKKGVRKEEVADIGLLEWLKSLPPKKPVTRDQMMQFVRDSKIDFIEIEMRPSNLSVSRNEVVRMESAQEQMRNVKESIKASIIEQGFSEADAEQYIRDIENVGIVALDGVLEPILVAHYDAMLDQAHLDQWQAEFIFNQSRNEDSDFITVDQTKYEQWSLLNGTRPTYREFLMKIPSRDDVASYITRHWTQSNVLLHLRMHGQFDADTGQTTLVIEEIQSDWHQQGYRYGYSSRNLTPTEMGRLLREQGKVPPAPMAENWKMIGMKRLIRYAAENGYHNIAWVTGETQAERYSIAGRFHSVELQVDPDMNNSFRLEVTQEEGGTPKHSEWMPRHRIGFDAISEELSDLLFEKLKRGERPILTGEELEWGGKGLRGFYDHALKKLTTKYIGKFGSKIELQEHTIINARGGSSRVSLWTFPVTDAMREAALQGQPLYSLSNDVGTEIGRRLELYQLRQFIEETTTSKTKPRVMKARLIDGATRGYYSSQILTHSGVLDHVGDRTRMLLQIAERVRGLEVDRRMSIPANIIRQELNRITRDWANPPRYRVHDTYHTLPSHIKAELLNWNYTQMMEGVYDPINDCIHLVAQNIHSMERLYRSFVEESLGHYGLREFFGTRFESFLDEVLPSVEGSDAWNDLMGLYKHINEAIEAGRVERARAKAAGRTPNRNVLDNAHRAKLAAVEELISKGDVDQTVWQKFVAWLRNILRDMRLITNYTENDIRAVMAKVHERIVNGNLPHAWGKRNHIPVFTSGVMRYSLYAGRDGLLLSKLEEAIKNPKMTNNQDAAKPAVWLNALRGQDAESGWQNDEPAKKASQTWGFSQTELKMTALVDFLLDRQRSAPNEKITRDEVLKVFYDTRPKIMAISRGGNFLFPSLPLSDLITVAERTRNSNEFNRERARAEFGFFTQYLNDILDEEGHTQLRKILKVDADTEVTPGTMWAFSVESPFGHSGVPTIGQFRAQGLSDEQISSLFGIENFNDPVSSTNITPAMKAFIGEQIVNQFEREGTVFRNFMQHYYINLHGYGMQSETIALGWSTNAHGEIDAIVSTNNEDPGVKELLDRINKRLQVIQQQKVLHKQYIDEATQRMLTDDSDLPEGWREAAAGPAPQDLPALIKQSVLDYVEEQLAYIRDNQLGLHELNPSEIFPAFPELGAQIYDSMSGSVATKGRTEYGEGTYSSSRSASLYSQYTLKGGENLDVISIQMYGGAKNKSNNGNPGSSHYDSELLEDVVHMRVKERTGPNGERILGIEEVQSDWASSYRHYPAKPEEYGEWFREYAWDILKAMEWVKQNYGIKFTRVFEGFIDEGTLVYSEQQVKELRDQSRRFAIAFANDIMNTRTAMMMLETAPEDLRLRFEKAQKAYPSQPDFQWMPWVTLYPELAMNAAVAWARDQGFDGVAWYGQGSEAAALYGGRIGQTHDGIRINLETMAVWGGNAKGDDGVVRWNNLAEYANADANGNGYPYLVDYLAGIVKEGGENGEAAKAAIRFIQTFIEEGGMVSLTNGEGTLEQKIAEHDGPGMFHLVGNQILMALPERRYWNANLHKLLYEQLLVQAAKKISKKSVKTVYIEDAYNQERRGYRDRDPEAETDTEDLELNLEDDRVRGDISTVQNGRMRWWTRIFGRNGWRLRNQFADFVRAGYAEEGSAYAEVDVIESVNDFINSGEMEMITMTPRRVLTFMSSDADNINPYTAIVEFEYEGTGGEKKTIEFPIVYHTRNEDERFGIYPDELGWMEREGALESGMMQRMAYKVMRDIWGIEDPDPTRLGRDGLHAMLGQFHEALLRYYQGVGGERVKNAAFQSQSQTNMQPWVEATEYQPAWGDIYVPGDLGVPVEVAIGLPSTSTEYEEQLDEIQRSGMWHKLQVSSVLSSLIPALDQEQIDDFLGRFDDFANGAPWMSDFVPTGYVEGWSAGLTEEENRSAVVAEATPKFGPDNPEFSEQIWNYIEIDDVVQDKPIFMPFSLIDPDKKARSIINKKIAKAASNMTVLDRVTNWLNLFTDYIKTGDMMWGIRQGLLDDAASVKRWEREIFGQVLDASVSPYKMMHMTKNLPSVMAAIAKAGIPQLQDGVFQPVAGRKGFIEIFRPLYEHPQGDLLELWEGYAAARRSKDLINQRNPDGTSREKLFNQGEIDELLELGEKYPIFKTVFAEWTRFNNDLLDLAVEHGVLSARERDVWAQNDYVPFYRAMEEIEGIDQRTGFGRIKAGVSGQHSGIKRLKGGTQKLGSVVENMWFNTASLIDKVYKNEAMTRVVDMLDGVAMNKIDMPWEAVKVTNAQIARALRKAGVLGPNAEAEVKAMTTQQKLMWNTIFRRVRPTADNVVSVMRDGKLVYYEIPDDEMLLRTLQGMGAESLVGMMKAMGVSKSILTRMITIDPGFMLANWMRDTLSAWVTSDANFVPVADSIAAMKDVFKEEGTFVKMMMSGAGGGGFYDLTGGNVAKALNEELNRGPTRWLGKAWKGYMKLGAASENSNRLAIANRIIKKGGTAAEAMYQAQDIMNFTMSGDYAAVRFLIRTVPFLNARLQGLYRLGRGAKDHPVGFALKGAALMAASLALLARNWDDPDYELTEDWMKDVNWNFYVGGFHYTIPKPFEVGLLFATVPERLARLIGGRDDLGIAKEAFWRGVGSTLAFNPIPQLFKPMYELGANQNLFTGRQIENLALQRYEYPYRAHPWTSPVAQWVGKMMPDWSGPFQSPVRIEHAVRAYTGTVGLYTLNSLDWLVRQFDKDQPEMPTKAWWERPVISRVVRGPTETTRNNKYEERIYDVLRQANEAQNTFNLLARTQRISDAKQLAANRRPMVNTDINVQTGQANNPDAMTARKELNKIQAELRKVSQAQRSIMYDKTMDGDRKRELIDKLQIQRNAVLKQAAILMQKMNDLKEQLEEMEE